MCVSFNGRRRRRAAAADRLRRGGFRSGTAADDGDGQLGLREPERALGLDCGAERRDALARLLQQREHVDLHRAEPQLALVADDLPERQHLALVVRGDVVARAIGAIGVARLRPDVDRLLGQAVHGLHVRRFGLTDAHLSEIEDRNLQAARRSRAP